MIRLCEAGYDVNRKRDIGKIRYSNNYYKKRDSNKTKTKNEQDVLAMGHFQFRAMFYLGRHIILLI